SVYGQLHRLARHALQSERAGHSLQPTLLVNDAYMRLMEQRNLSLDDHSAVMAAGATIIRRLLVDYARKRRSQKRGGKTGRGVPLQPTMAEPRRHDVLEISDAIEQLGIHHCRAAQVVDLKFFGGLTCEEISHQLDVSVRTVKNDWRFAKAWLHRELGSESAGPTA
ncbi:MAG: ECF-type sigma factor, partial [Rubripirellula sp.]